jgi:signal transduction histidine kinase
MAIAVRELIHNAYKFSNPGSQITVRAACDDNWVLIQVQDAGRGIPEEEFEKIWLDFYQINRDHYEDQGAGSGLAIVRGVMNLHAGQYEVESTLGQGSTFTLKFPINGT